jgi:hypothetical protein
MCKCAGEVPMREAFTEPVLASAAHKSLRLSANRAPKGKTTQNGK